MRAPSLVFWAVLLVLGYRGGLLWSLCWIAGVAAATAIFARWIVRERWLQLQSPPPDAAVLITGTSTGFGRLLALDLCTKGPRPSSRWGCSDSHGADDAAAPGWQAFWYSERCDPSATQTIYARILLAKL